MGHMNALRKNVESSILYVASRLPELSETFVHRELCGVRSRGRRVFGASVHKPRRFAKDDSLMALADEVVVVYAWRTFVRLPVAFALSPAMFFRAIRDARRSDHTNLASRLKHIFQAAMGLSLASRLSDRGIGHVHAHMANVPATVGLYIARGLGAHFSFTGHAADLFVQRGGLKFKIEQSTFVACISEWHQQFYRSITDIDSDRLPIIRCSVALPPVAADRQRECLTREILTVARLVPKKGIDILLQAFAKCDLPDWRLRIIGDGDQREALETLAQLLCIEDRVTFAGAMPHGACLAVIAVAGMFVLPCRKASDGDQDGIPVALMEAMAASRPVICGDLPTIRELVQDGQSGLLVPQGDSTSLAAAMQLVAGDDHLAGQLGTHARARVEIEFSDAVNLDRLCAAFDNAVPVLGK